MGIAYHVTSIGNAKNIIESGFLGGFGDAGFGVYMFENLWTARDYLDAGGWDNSGDPDEMCILELEVPVGEAEYLTPDPGWPNPEDYADVIFHEMDQDDAEALWQPERKLLADDPESGPDI